MTSEGLKTRDHPLWPAFEKKTKNMHTSEQMKVIWWEMFLAGAAADRASTPKQTYIQNTPTDPVHYGVIDGGGNQQAE